MGSTAPTPVLLAFGRTVRSIREQRGLSQEALAHEAGLHRTYMSELERGLRNIGLTNIVKIADALGVEPSELLART